MKGIAWKKNARSMFRASRSAGKRFTGREWLVVRVKDRADATLFETLDKIRGKIRNDNTNNRERERDLWRGMHNIRLTFPIAFNLKGGIRTDLMNPTTLIPVAKREFA